MRRTAAQVEQMADRIGFSSAAEIAGAMGLRSLINPALCTILDHGGHLVLVRRGLRKPVWDKWQLRKPSLDVVAGHNGRVGLVPHSIGSSALDVDFGDPINLPRPWAKYRSKRPGGAHFYYGDDEARGNGNWSAAGCSGQVRSARGYLILHPGAAEKIARALKSGVQLSLFPFPAELLKRHEAELIVPDPVKLHAVNPHGKVSLRLEGVYEGARNDSLFEVGRQWAYRQRRGDDLGAWIAGVHEFFLFNNKRFPDPLHASEVRTSAYSVSTWVWSRLNEITPKKSEQQLDHSSIAQSWRGTWSGVSRRRETQARDREIVQAVKRGESMRAVAAEFDLTVSTIHWIVGRSVR